MKLLVFIERPHLNEMVEGDLLSKFKQKKYPNRGMPNKALSKHKLWFTKWTTQTKISSRINNERANILPPDLFGRASCHKN